MRTRAHLPRHTFSRFIALAGTAALVLAGVVAGPAAAETTTTSCSALGDVVEHRKIVGDLSVDSYTCRVDTVTVTGDVVVAASAGDASITSTAIKGDLRVDGYLEIARSTVHGGVLLANGADLYANDTTIHRSLRGDSGRVGLYRVQLDGALNIAGEGWTSVVQSRVGGWVNTQVTVLQLWRSTFDRGLTAKRLHLAIACGVDVAGDVTLTHAADRVAVADTAHRCASDGLPGLSVGGDLLVVENRHSVTLQNTTVAGDLVCTQNSGPLGVTVADDVVVGGTRTGQCA